MSKPKECEGECGRRQSGKRVDGFYYCCARCPEGEGHTRKCDDREDQR